jgi:6-phosphogluconolactonase
MILIYDDLEALSHAAAGLFFQKAQHAVAERGWFAVALSGGSTPRRTYELLAEPPCRDRVPWSQVHVFWGDERCVPAGDPRSNARLAREALLDHVPVLADQVHPIDCAEAPDQAAATYEALLRRFFGDEPPRFDLVFLGLGENGHTASLFPRTPVLEEQKRWVAAVQPAGQDLQRVTLTAPLLNQAAVVAFLVSGADKAGVLRAVLEGPHDPRRLPAQLIAPPDGILQWLLDEPASQLLTRST